MTSSSLLTSTPSNLATDLAECGWRTLVVTEPDGTTTSVKVLLTASEFLHPQEGYRLPNSTFHGNVAGDAKDMLTRRYANSPDVGIFRDRYRERFGDL